MIWNTINVTLYFSQAEQIYCFFPPPFLNVYDLMFVCVKLCACEHFVVVVLISCVCVRACASVL